MTEIGFVGLETMGGSMTARVRELERPLPGVRLVDALVTQARELGYEHRDIAAHFEVLARGGTP